MSKVRAWLAAGTMARRRPIVRTLRRLWVAAGLGVMGWLAVSFQAHGVDPAVLESGPAVEVVTTAEALRFVPRAASRGSGLIFLPGAMVDPVAYAPLARALAERGYPTVILKLPFRLALTQSQQAALATRIRALTSTASAERWALGGHSRGAALASQLAAPPELGVDRLILVGTTHPKAPEWDLSQRALAVTKIYGSEDGLASEAEVLANSRYLPPTTRFVRVAGGNHAQFGWYGSQLGDGRAQISRAEQQRQLEAAIVAALER